MIVLRKNESIDKALKRFRKYVEKERILSTLAKKRYHLTKSQKRRVKERRAMLLRKKKEKKMQKNG